MSMSKVKAFMSDGTTEADIRRAASGIGRDAAAVREARRILAETEPTIRGRRALAIGCACPEHLTRYCPLEALAESLAQFIALDLA